MRRHSGIKSLLFGLVGLIPLMVGAGEKPNIVVILADDMGFGELSCLNPNRGKIKTPQLDRIAASGMTFSDGHSGSSVCTPTRYGLLTGRYAWRTRLQRGVLTGGESLIAADRMTVPMLLKQQGYHTAIIGKWHLGALFDGKHVAGKVPIGTKVTHGPLDRGGFDEFHGFHHARQMSLWIDNDEVTEELKPVEMLPKLAESAVSYIRSRKGSEDPFFLYVPWNAPHSPVVPTKEWQGKSGLNPHADFVMQTDDCFGQVYRALEETGQLENTLILCSSDNGTSPNTSGLKQLLAKGHHPSGDLRGGKADLWDGGHRVPFIVSWKGKVAPGAKSDALVCLTDLFATAADLLDADYPDRQAVDSISFLPVLLDEEGHQRKDVIHHSFSGKFSIRSGDWKLLLAAGSGGWANPKDAKALAAGAPKWQLYQMCDDLGEEKNLFETHPEKAGVLRDLLEKQMKDGRSTPGAKQKNDVSIDLEKNAKPASDKGGKPKKERKGRKAKKKEEG